MAVTLEEAAEVGLDLQSPMSSSFAARWDPKGDTTPRDFGWIGVDSEGVWMKIDPSAALSQRPDLWPVVDAFRYGGQTELTREDWDELSAFHFEAKRVMVAARANS